MNKQLRKSAPHSRVLASPRYFPAPPLGGLSLPFSEAVALGDTLYVSGQIGNLPEVLKLAPGGIEPETRQMFANIRAILERHGSALERVVKCTVFLADIKEWPAFNAIYREFFPKHLPARSALAASGLAFNARVEMECVAFIPPKR